MKTNIMRSVQKIYFSAVLVLFCFTLLSFSTDTTSQNLNNEFITVGKKTIKINKNTTREELETIKKTMADEGLGFDYSNVVYNNNSEIISITISYKDKNNNSGKYSVSSKEPINDIIIDSEGDRISVKSEGSSNQAFINQGNGGQDSDKNENSYNNAREAMEKEMAEMEKVMAERRAAMELRMQQQREQRDSLHALKNRTHLKSPSTLNESSHVITKNTTNSELLKISKIYDSEDISFSYNSLERNGNNEITHISLTINNRNGSISTSTFGNGTDAIKNILVAVDKQHTVMKSVE